MPRVLSEDGFDFYIYFDDHNPPHVHVYKSGGEIRIEIETSKVMSQYEVNRQNVKKAKAITTLNRVYLSAEWSNKNG